VVVKGIAGSFGLPRVVDGYPNNGDAIASAKLLHILTARSNTNSALISDFVSGSLSDYIKTGLYNGRPLHPWLRRLPPCTQERTVLVGYKSELRQSTLHHRPCS
jgi:hypothetical protein